MRNCWDSGSDAPQTDILEDVLDNAFCCCQMYFDPIFAVLTPDDFLKATVWSLGFTGFFALLALVAFLFKWGLRFRLVGVTGFMVVLTSGLFALSIFPITTTVVPGAVNYSVVYDDGGGQVVITVPQNVTESQLEATLRQTAINKFSPGRLGRDLLIRARTVLHPEPGVSEPLYLGQVTRSLSNADESQFEIEIDRDRLARLERS
ncbi:Ycf51 family protein [Baaleninema simplex]|uniref:Ycf51 family protein n=1 Tax=Baaleninema simplex TaxID=2862350 RepID=UPI001FDF8FC8|nr:Ycf51 family protein [Baaleninema simplex]